MVGLEAREAMGQAGAELPSLKVCDAVYDYRVVLCHILYEL